MKTRSIVFVLAAAGVALVAGCNRGDTSASGSGKPTVALVVKTLNNPFFIEMQKGAEEAAKKAGVTLVVQAADRR